VQQSYADVVKRSERIFGLMREIVESPDGRLTAYKADFYLHDRHYLTNTLATGKYLWSVQHSGTELKTLGVHEKNHEWMRAVMNAYSSRDLYLIDADRGSIKAVSDGEALDLMRSTQYKVAHGVVSTDRGAIASINVKLTRQTANTRSDICDISYESVSGSALSDRDLVALSQMAWSESVKAAGTLFVGVGKVTLDGKDLFAEIGPKVPELTAQVTWYGKITASADEARFLESMKIDLGKYDPASGAFPAKVSESAYNELQHYADSFKLDLAPLPHAFKPEGEIQLGKALNRISTDRLEAYERFLTYEAASVVTGQPDRAVALQTAQADVSAEISRRAAKAIQVRDRVVAAAQPSVAQV